MSCNSRHAGLLPAGYTLVSGSSSRCFPSSKTGTRPRQQLPSNRIALKPKDPPQKPYPKSKKGRPTDYSPHFCDKVMALGELGKSRHQLAVALGCCKRTFQTWEKKYPDFLAATTRARELAQAWWEDQGQIGIWEGNKFNANAYRLQMTNRFPDQWRDKRRLEHARKDNSPVIAEWVSMEDLRQELLRRGLTLPQCEQIANLEKGT
jgi:hypothetical protein